MSPGVLRHGQGESPGGYLYKNFRAFPSRVVSPLMVGSYPVFLPNITAAGIWMEPGPQSRAEIPPRCLTCRDENPTLQNSKWAPCSMPYVQMVHRIQIPILPAQCHTPSFFWNNAVTPLHPKYVSESLFRFTFYLYCCVLDFQKVPLSHFSNAAHKFLYLWIQGPLCPVDSPKNLWKEERRWILGWCAI